MKRPFWTWQTWVFAIGGGLIGGTLGGLFGHWLVSR